MLDSLYENIGVKIKNWAKWIFIVEAIGAIITGIILATEEDILYIFIAIGGPIIAWVSSWILYAFGELVEDTHAMRKKYYPMAEEQANRESEEKAMQEAKEKAMQEAEEARQKAEENTFFCPMCSNTVNYGDAICSSCGQRFDWSRN